jgi:septum site-determining protein MinC
MISSFIIQIMPNIAIKQNKKGTFLDLSSQDLSKSSFKEDFCSFSNEISKFLSGTSVSIIMPEDSINCQMIIEEIKTELNKNNISLKKVFSKDNNEIDFGTECDINEYNRALDNNSNKEIIDVSSLPETLYVEANLRSGQLIRYPGNVFVLGDVNPSAEIIANGDIIIWGTLRGLAHAGSNGNKYSKIISMEIINGQVRIADLITSIQDSTSKEKKKSKEKVPMLVKIENNEIIISRYFG